MPPNYETYTFFRFTPAHLNRYFFGQKSVYAIQSAIRIKIFKVKTKDPRTARLVRDLKNKIVSPGPVVNFNFFACAAPARRGPGTTGLRPWIPSKTDLMKFVVVKNPGTLY